MRIAPVVILPPQQSCDVRNSFRQASKGRDVGTVPTGIKARRNDKAAMKVAALSLLTLPRQRDFLVVDHELTSQVRQKFTLLFHASFFQ